MPLSAATGDDILSVKGWRQVDEGKIRILIVDDHPFFREGVKLYLDSVAGFELVGAAQSGEQALEMVASNRVDVVLMDLQMTGMDGIASTRAVLARDPEVRVLILTSFGSGEKVQQALAAGASGYCLKNAPPGELAAAIQAVAFGGTYLGRGVTPQALAAGHSAAPVEGSPAHEQIASLTERELDVLKLLARGLGNREIAEQLVVTEKTVKTHVANILQKMNVKTRTQAALQASRLGVH